MYYEYSSSLLKNIPFHVWVTQEVVSAREVEVYRGIDSICWPDLVAVPEMIATDRFQSLIKADPRQPNMYPIQSLAFWRSQMLRFPKCLNYYIPSTLATPSTAYMESLNPREQETTKDFRSITLSPFVSCFWMSANTLYQRHRS